MDRTRGDTGRLGALELGHAVFAPFRAARSGDFSSVRVYGYRRLSPAPGTQVLARYDDGQPALVAARAGRGQVLAWTTSLDLSWNDLALKPIYLPFLHQALRTLGGFDPRPAAFTVGQVVSAGAAPAGRTRVVVAPDGTRTPIEAARGDAFDVAQPGFYEVRDASNDAVRGRW